MLFLMTMLTGLFAVHSDYFIIKTCLSVCGETTIHSTGDVLLEREFKYLLLWYIAWQYLVNKNTNDTR